MAKINGNYLDISEYDLKPTKVYTTRMGALLGKDNFNKKGDMLLKIWKIAPKDTFDTFYTARGEVAEKYIDTMLTNQNISHKWFGAETNTYDMFNNPFFGGNLDFSLNDNETCEIKSKNVKDYGFISKNGPDKTHLAQAELATYLSGYDKGKIVYVFFTNEQESLIKKAQENNELPTFKQGELEILIFDINYVERKATENMTQVYDYYQKCFNEKKIPLGDISDSMLKSLNLEVKQDIFSRGIK